jgi:hypothetical protein
MTYIFKPLCFPDQNTYREWVDLAKIAREVVNPCEDCTMSYEREMRQAGLCNKFWVQNNLVIGGRSKVSNQGVFK